ncbi:hypothetical protein AB833_30170 [Chromatiales bacterium (ex Bugula neritina AB1)]|nr:hypothetical protein AB833_30170 [Chromatiales bacterium (ex Bugula neritina AB1)]
MVSEQLNKRITRICGLLQSAASQTRVLSHLRWDGQIRDKFLADAALELPVVEYPAYDAEPVLELVAEARRLMQQSPIDDWLERQALALENSARMLLACGTAEFFSWSRSVYGAPGDVLLDQVSTALTLAGDFDDVLQQLNGFYGSHLDQVDVTSDELAGKLESAVAEMFGPDAPEILVVDELSANALAGRERIRIRRNANFSDKDVDQLIHHEAGIHVATSLNGMYQQHLPVLGSAHPGTTRTQEGLAVFAEFITGSMDLDRLRRLSDRIIAIQMAVDGADFIEVYHYFMERTGSRQQSFENSRRVFRGGVLTGGAPFTKDIVYLDGLIRVHNFLRALVANGRADCMLLLFCGKLDLEDIPVLCELSQMGLCKQPRYLPSWASDMRFLLSYLAYSGFLNTINLRKISSHYENLLRSAPLVEMGS